MRLPRAAAALIAGVLACAGAARASDAPPAAAAATVTAAHSTPAPASSLAPAPAPATADGPDQLRARIDRGIADALARRPGQAAVTPAPALSHPTEIPRSAHARSTAPHADVAPRPVPSPADTSAEGIWNDLLTGNQRFAAGHGHARGPLHAAAPDSEPAARAVVLGCSDSDAGPEDVFDQAASDLFVVRTSGNMVDPVALGSVEYAVTRRHARVLVVLGHDGCGAVRAAAGNQSLGSAYLDAIVDRIRPIVQRLSSCFEGEELVQRSVIANARQSAQDVLSNSALLRAAAAHGTLKVYCAIYDPRTGAVTPVSVPGATAQAQAPAR